MKTKAWRLGGVLLGLALSNDHFVSVAKALDTNFDQQVLEKRLSAADWQEWASLTKLSTFVEKEPIRVFTQETTSTNLDFEIFVGPQPFPSFAAAFKPNELTRARIDLGVTDSVVVSRKQTTNTSYFLMLLASGDDRKLYAQFDLNIDGVWDVKEMGSRKYIFLEKDWLEVDEIKSRNSERPTAQKGEKHYEFQKSWRLDRQ